MKLLSHRNGSEYLVWLGHFLFIFFWFSTGDSGRGVSVLQIKLLSHRNGSEYLVWLGDFLGLFFFVFQ